MRFDVWCAPNGQSEFSVKVDDLALVTVEAENAIDARWHPDVRQVLMSDFYVLDMVAPAGTTSQTIMRIRERTRRAIEDADRPDGFRDANSSRRGLPRF